VFSMRHFLVFVQLLICVAVIASTILMARQMRYVHERPLGFEKENRLLVTLRRYDVLKNLTTIKEELRRVPGVIDVSNVMQAPGTGNFVNLIPIENESGVVEPIEVDRIMVGVNFLETMKIPLVEGRGFSRDIESDPQDAVLVNESMVRRMGWTNAIGKRVARGPDHFFRVVGVVKDFNYASLHNRVGPLVLNAYADMKPGLDPGLNKDILYANVVVALAGEQLGETIESITAVISRFDPTFQFEPEFLEDRLSELYRSESNLMSLTGVFAGICILISIMGLYGLTAYTIEERTREIGVRRVLGASPWQIVAKLARPVMLLVVLAAIPASIISHDAIGRWLLRFAYHEPIAASSFVVSAVVVAAVTFLTVVAQIWKALSAEPVEALRHE
jgi:putative ABC transport system permease protein